MDAQTIQQPLLPVEPEVKLCRVCKVVKPVEEFHLRTLGKPFRKYRCKACRTVMDRERLRKKDKLRKVTPGSGPRCPKYKAGDGMRVKIKRIGEPKACYLCGDTLTWDAAQLDHVIPRCKGGNNK